MSAFFGNKELDKLGEGCRRRVYSRGSSNKDKNEEEIRGKFIREKDRS